MPTPRSTAFLAWIEAHPARTFTGFLALHAALWTALPALLYPNLPLDLIEALMYGREWQLGYDKLPPLPWWLVQAANMTIGHDFAYYLLAQIAVAGGFAFVFLAARPLVGTLGALVSVLIVDGLHYLNYTSAKFNHDVVQLPFWAMAGFAFHRALRGRQTADWLLLGFAVGMALWAKYFVAVLAIPLALFVLIDPEAQKTLKTPGPYLAAAAALITMAPHLIWLVRNDFLPFGYAEHRAVLSRGWYDHLWHPLQFAIGQLFFLLPALAIAAPLFLPRKGPDAVPQSAAADGYDRRIVTLLAFGPMATVLAMSAVSGRGTVAMWGYPLWLFLGLWIVLAAPYALAGLRLKRLLATWAVVFSCLALAFIVNYAVLPQYDHRYRAVFYPGADIAREISDRYFAATGKYPAYVIGSMWDGGNLEHYGRSHPRNLVDGKPARAPWIDLADLRARGAVVLWTFGDTRALPRALGSIAAEASLQMPFELNDLRGGNKTNVGWAILLPRPSYAALP